jgi:CRISPR type III-B/RAMP module RAMP protein Cmr6
MARIPIAGDVVDAIGPFAERVENRSLLLDKFPFHKQWGLGELKANDAHRWTLLRISDGGSALLSREAEAKRSESQRLAGKNPEKSQRLGAEAAVAGSLSSTRVESAELTALRAQHTRRLIGLFRSAFVGRSVVAIAELEGRLAINLADSLIQNAGISLDRLFGLPFIAGSAVKGVCRHAALEELKSADGSDRQRLFEEFREVFGTADNDFARGDLQACRDLLGGRAENFRGRISFLPAYPVNEAKVVVDLTNVHYPDYYRSGGTENLSNERPLPNPFPAVERGAQFAFLLVLNRPDADARLIEPANRWLEAALTVRGIGAKTAAGYGWFSLQPAVLEEIAAAEKKAEAAAQARLKQEAEMQAKAAAEAVRIAAMPPAEVARERFSKLTEEAFAKAVTELASLSPDEQKGLVLALLGAEKKDSWKRWKKSDKPANKARVEALLAAAKTHGVNLP